MKTLLSKRFSYSFAYWMALYVLFQIIFRHA